MNIDIQPLIDDLEKEIIDLGQLFEDRLESLKKDSDYDKALKIVLSKQQNDKVLNELRNKITDKRPTLKYLQDKLEDQNANLDPKGKRASKKKKKNN